jgi:gamma-glutamyltranspeptidase/glutathione hydrolase
MTQVRHRTHRIAVLGVAGATALAGLGLLAPTAQADGQRHYTTKTPTSTGFGGAVSSVDPEASRVGLRVLKHGGNAVDAAIATAAALGVTEPYSSGLGGGGYFVYYNARSHRIRTLDGRETAPKAMPHDAFIDPSTGKPYPFTPELVTSGVSVGVPGTPATWDHALRRWGTYSLRRALRPAARLADRGFLVDDTFRQQTLDNQKRFEAYTTTPRLFLPHGDAPQVGSVFRNRALARTYRRLGRDGMRSFYHGAIARQIASLVRHPPKSPETQFPVPAGFMTPRDLGRYDTVTRRPTHVRYRGYHVYGMRPSSSGGSTVGESLNIMKQFPLRRMDMGAALHHYLEATALAFADRAAYVGDPKFVHVPLKDLLSPTYAAERACQIDEHTAFTPPVKEGDVKSYDGTCGGSGSTASGTKATDTENVETTNLTVTDKWGNIVEYTLTIEQTGGSGMLVPGRGFLLNNELTDFSAEYDPADPNRIEPLKRPRSSISPTIILRNGKPFLALGSPGGSTIITTVTQMIFNRIDRQMTLPEAIADPRAQQPNTATVNAEPAFIDKYGALLTPYGHKLKPSGDKFTSAAQIGAATAIEFGRHGLLTAVAEPTRRGGGSALVVRPRR